jgi:hypothetical protein
MEKQKHQVSVTRGTTPASRIPQTSLAIILIIVGVVFALVTLDVVSFSSIGEFFGGFGRFFGELGSSMGRFFGSIGRWWPLILMAVGAFLLIRRRPANSP